MNEKQLNRIKEMISFAERRKADDEKSLKLYKAGSKTDDAFVLFHDSELSGKIIYWEWVIDSLKEVLKMRDGKKLK